MKFGRVQGHGRRITRNGQASIAFAVMFDTGGSATVVRDEVMPWLSFGPIDDVAWQIDQLTQETIGTTLAAEGWEAFSEDQGAQGETQDGLSHSSVYVVRNMGDPSGPGGEAG
jgi:hypothetical protein